MLVLLSPSKTMDFSGDVQLDYFTQPSYVKEAEALVNHMRGYSPDDLGQLMNISDKLAKMNYERFQQFQTPLNLDNARQALLAYRGDVYDGIAIRDYKKEDFSFAQEEVRILSGLYGILRPLDLIQPYRLEMSTKIQPRQKKDLYDFWQEKITQQLNEELQNHKNHYVINLASNEYFKAVKTSALNAEVITPIFKENKNGRYKTIAIYAKKARGMMTDYIIQNRIFSPDGLKGFDYDGYLFNEALSDDKNWVFTRG